MDKTVETEKDEWRRCSAGVEGNTRKQEGNKTPDKDQKQHKNLENTLN